MSLGLAVATIDCGQGQDTIESETLALASQNAVAFQRSTNVLWVDQTGPGTGVNTGFQMKPGTVPSQVGVLRFSPFKFGFHGSNGHFWIGEFGGGATDSNGLMAGGTSPSISRFSNGNIGFAIQGANGHLWVGSNGPFGGVDTGGVMAGGSSPSVAAQANGNLAFAIRGANGHLWMGLNGPFSGVDTGGVMASGTNPAVAATPDGHVIFAIQGANGHLWVGMDGPFSGKDTGFVMRAGTSPAAAAADSISLTLGYFAFQALDGHLCVFRQNGNMPFGADDTLIQMAASASPSIVPTSSGYTTWGKGFNGNLWIATGAGGQKEDQGMAMN